MRSVIANGTNPFRMLALLLAAALAAGLLALVGTKSAEAAFPGKNGKIAFDTHRDGNFEIYTINPNGSMPTNLTNNSAGDESPAFSPDGKEIAFHTDRDGNFEIYKMGSDGSNPIRLTINPGTDSTADWGVRPQKRR